MRSLLMLAACAFPTVPEERYDCASVDPPPAPEGGGEPDPTVGRVVLYRVGGTDEEPELRPAFVVRTWPGMSHGSANLQVFVDGKNDRVWLYPGREAEGDAARLFDEVQVVSGLAWRTSVHRGTAVGEWRWPKYTATAKRIETPVEEPRSSRSRKPS